MLIRIPKTRGLVYFLVVGSIIAIGASMCEAQVLETETARLLSKGRWKAGLAYEYQTSSDGTETAVPFLVEYGLTNRFELTVEPVAHTSINPNLGDGATGAGDIEMTATFRAFQESGAVPALALALESKIPTARDNLIGTGEADYTGYLIGSKRVGQVDLHANLSYTVVGSPPGVTLQNMVGFAFAGMYRPNAKMEFFGEVLGNTESAPEGGPLTPTGENAVTPEAAGGELSGTLGAGRAMSENLLIYLAGSYDNSNATLIRLGFTLGF